MRIWLTLIAMIVFFVLSYFCIGTDIVYKNNVWKIDVERDTPDSVRIHFFTTTNHFDDSPGVIMKETDHNFVVGLVNCRFYQICFVDIKRADEGKIRIKNKDKPIKIRYRRQFSSGNEENLMEQIWPLPENR
jgi:hypothetical protein